MRRVLIIMLSLGLGAFSLFAPVGSAQAKDSPAATIVDDDPANGTPHVLDGRVLSIAEVGNMIILGGTFSRASNDGSNTELNRRGLLAFNKNTGQISTSFVPQPDGIVQSVIPAGDGESVYVAGRFGTIGGVSRKNVARVRVSDGAVLTQFNVGGISGQVKDLRLFDGRLWLAGAFSQVGGNEQGILATVDPTTGNFDPYMGLSIAGTHNGGSTNLYKIDVTPDGERLVAVGNVATVESQAREQLFMLDTSGGSASLADFSTSFYEGGCASVFDSYMRDIDVSPSGEYFVVSTTGAGRGPTSPCDTTARWEIGGGPGSSASWIDTTGGDTTYAVEITPGDVVYVGGHQRWQNNPYGRDSAGPGAVAREGIAALSGVNGLPLSWNPTRTRGVGVFDFLYTSQGLWVGSNTDRIGNFEYHGRIALMPIDGSDVLAEQTPGLPNDIYSAGASGSASDPSVLYRVNAGGPTQLASSGPDWAEDTDGSPSPYHNQVSRRASGSTLSVDSTVPNETPRAIFNTELWDPADNAEQSWDFPVDADIPVEVRLYFANTCSCTNDPGERVFDVDVEGARLVEDLDLSAQVGHQVGTMRSVEVTSDGNIDIDLLHQVENPLVNGIEIVRTDVEPPAGNESVIVKRGYDSGQVGTTEEVGNGGVNWNAARGGFMLNGQVYTGTADGRFLRRSYDGTDFGSAVEADTQDDITPLTDWEGELQSIRGMTYDFGRVYFTLAGSDQLYYRYFSAESDVVGGYRYVASGSVPGIDFSQVRGMFLTEDSLYWATPEGALMRIDWAHGPQSGAPVGGTAEQVSGPGMDAQTWNARAMFLFQGPNGGNGGGGGGGSVTEPTSSFTVSCNYEDCSFDGSDSSANGDEIDSYAWDFGDGQTGNGATTSHTYGGSGMQTATLTVTTTDGGSDTSSRTFLVEARPDPGAGAVTFVESMSSAGNRRNHVTDIPSSVQAGDTLLAFFTVNSPDANIAAPAGWTRLEVVDGNRVQGVAWTKTATGSDAGSTVTVQTGTWVKSAFAVAAYRGTDGDSSVATSAVALENPSGTQHTTPTVPVDQAESWLVSYWSEKSSSSPAWTLPNGTDLHESPAAAGGGAISARLADSGAPVGTGTAGGLTATTSTDVSRAIMFSVVVQPTVATAPPNRAPQAAFTSSCSGLACDFDATGSSDPDDDQLTYSWDFGDGSTDTGATVSHPYGSAGSREVTLTVSDGELDDQASRTVNTVEAGAQAVSFVGSNSSAGNRRDHRVTIPQTVQAGDTLVAFYTVNSPDANITAPAGWSRLQAVDGNRVQGVAWTKTATGSDAGSTVTVTSATWIKSAFSLGAYRGAGGASAVTDSGIALENPSGTQHVTPEVTCSRGRQRAREHLE